MSLRPSARTEVRRNRYKVAVDAGEGRRRREDNMVEIRKNRREESLQKKRREGLQSQAMPSSLHSSAAEKKLEHLPTMVVGVWSEDGSLQLEATTQFRKLLSVGEKLLLGVYVIIIYAICITCFCCQFLLPEHSPPIEEVIC